MCEHEWYVDEETDLWLCKHCGRPGFKSGDTMHPYPAGSEESIIKAAKIVKIFKKENK